MARNYVSRLARMSSPDPVAGSIVNPQSLNRYAYVANDPADLTDPSGLIAGCSTVRNKTDDASDSDSDGVGMLPNEEMASPDPQNGCRVSGGGDPFGDGSWTVDSGFAGDDSGMGMGVPIGDGDVWGLAGIHFVGSWYGDHGAYTDGPDLGWGVFLFGDLGGSGGGGNIKPWDLRKTLVDLLRAKNDCSNWFNQGTGSPADIISHVPINLYTPKNPSYNMPDAGAGISPPAIYVNSLGRFYTDRWNSSSVGGFSAGSFGARSVILLHELAHIVSPPEFIGSDAGTPGTSEKNTQMVVDHCLHAILEATDAQKQ